MGVNKSQSAIRDPTKGANLIDETHEYSVYRDKNGHEYEKYKVQNLTNDFSDRFHYRIKSPNQNLVRAFYIKQLGNVFSCNTSNFYQVVIERIPYRLSDFTKLTSEEGIHILKGALKGFDEVYRTIGLIFVKQSMIGINNQNQVKVWINPRFQLTHIQPQPVSYENINKKRRESVMIDNIFELIKIKVKNQPVWTSFSHQWQNLFLKSFQKAISFVEHFATINNITVKSAEGLRTNNEAWPTFDEQLKNKKSRSIQLHGIRLANSQDFQINSRVEDNSPRLQISDVKVNRYSQQFFDKQRINTDQNDRTTKSTFAQVRARATHHKNFQNPIFMTNSPSSVSYQNNIYNGAYGTQSIYHNQKTFTPIQNMVPINTSQVRKTNEPKVIITFGKSHPVQSFNRNLIRKSINIMENQIQQTNPRLSQNQVHPQVANNDSIVKPVPVQSIGSQIKKMLKLRTSTPVSQIRKNDRTSISFNQPLSKSSIYSGSVYEEKTTNHENQQKNTLARKPGKIRHKSNRSLSIQTNQEKTQNIRADSESNYKMIRHQIKNIEEVNIVQNPSFGTRSRERPLIMISDDDMDPSTQTNQKIEKQKQCKIFINKNGSFGSNQKRQSFNHQASPKVHQQRKKNSINDLLLKLRSDQSPKFLSMKQHQQSKILNRNQKSMQMSSISRTNSDLNNSITYKDLRNLLKSIQRKKV